MVESGSFIDDASNILGCGLRLVIIGGVAVLVGAGGILGIIKISGFEFPGDKTSIPNSTPLPQNSTARPSPSRTAIRTPTVTPKTIEECQPIERGKGALWALNQLDRWTHIPKPRKIIHKIPDETKPDKFRRVEVTEKSLPPTVFVGQFMCYQGMPKSGNIVNHVASRSNFFPRDWRQVRINNRRRT